MIAVQHGSIRRSRRRKALLITLVVVSVLACLVAVDATSRLFMKCDASTELVSSSAVDDALIVALPGMTAQPAEQYAPVMDALLAHGDVLLVDYGGPRADRFCQDVVVDVAARAVTQANTENHYAHVVFVGSSIGSLLAVDIIDRVDLSVLPSLVAVCAPNGSADLVRPLNNASALRYVPLGWLSNQFNPDGTPYRTSFWRDQVAYIATHVAPEASGLDDTLSSLTYVTCDSDEFVLPDAAQAWASAMAGAKVLHVASAHVDYRGQSDLWSQTLGGLVAAATEQEP